MVALEKIVVAELGVSAALEPHRHASPTLGSQASGGAHRFRGGFSEA